MKRNTLQRIRRFHTAREFLDANLDELLRFESEYNLKIGLSIRLAEGHESADEADFWAFESPDGRQLGQALRTSRDMPLILSRLPREILDSVVSELNATGLELTGVIGPKESASAFAKKWARSNGSSATVIMEQLAYEARKIDVPPAAGGELVVADDTHLDIALRWAEAFAHECFANEPAERSRTREWVSRLLPNGLLFFWRTRDGKLVSMASRNRETPNGATVSFVYTPEELRRRGFASCVVGYLSQRILDGGKSICNLFADAANPSSNRIYRRLGYELVGECVRYKFTPC